MSRIELVEWGGPVTVRLADRNGEAIAASGIVSVQRLGEDRWELIAGTKVGVARVGDVEVWIRPKVPIHRILFMLGYAKDPGWSLPTVGFAGVADLVPALAGAFADQVELALALGPIQGYTEVEDTTSVLRGRLREAEQLRRRFGLAVPLLVRFDDHSVDIAENQLLRGATERLLRVPGVPPAFRTRLRGIRQLLADVTPPPTGAPLPAWTPSRLNSRYHVALWLAELVLNDSAVDQTPGGVRVGGFLVDMARVFEDFVTAALTASFAALGGRCRAQDRHYLDIDNEVAIRPDLVWYRNGQPTAVIDAKYKAEKPAGFPEADLYQLLAYCTTLNLDHGHLVYAKGNETDRAYRVRHGGPTIHAHTLDLKDTPEHLLQQCERVAAVVAAAPTEAAR